jgi:hypothetical protein
VVFAGEPAQLSFYTTNAPSYPPMATCVLSALNATEETLAPVERVSASPICLPVAASHQRRLPPVQVTSAVPSRLKPRPVARSAEWCGVVDLVVGVSVLGYAVFVA